MDLPIPDRRTAGRALADALAGYAGRDDLLVLALPRGGVPVAKAVAEALDAPLDLMLVRKLGAPTQPELAVGAIATGGARVLNEDIRAALRISDVELERVAGQERAELERRQRAYRGDRPVPEMTGKCVILVDDGVATGATMRAAIAALRQHDPAEVVVAVPVAPQDTLGKLRLEADEAVCLASPEPFRAIGQWYRDFPQLDDETVRELLAESWGEPVT